MGMEVNWPFPHCYIRSLYTGHRRYPRWAVRFWRADEHDFCFFPHFFHRWEVPLFLRVPRHSWDDRNRRRWGRFLEAIEYFDTSVGAVRQQRSDRRFYDLG